MVSDTACWIWVTSLVTRDSSWPLVRRAKNAADWPRMWPNSAVADVAHHQLADVGHPVGRQVGADALDQVDGDDAPMVTSKTRSCRNRTWSKIGLIR